MTTSKRRRRWREGGWPRGTHPCKTGAGHSARQPPDSELKRVREVARKEPSREYPRQEPGAVVPHAGICAGGAGQPAFLPRPRDDFLSDKSDIDVLVDFKGNERLFERYFDLKEQLEQCFGRRVDVIQRAALKNPYVKQSIDCDRIALYEA